MQDLSYADALEAADEPHIVLLGPAACQGCGAWVEWAGLDWLALGTREQHRCEPFREGQRGRDMAHPMVARSAGAVLLEDHGYPLISVGLSPVPWEPTRGERLFLRWLGRGIVAALTLLVLVLVVSRYGWTWY